MSFAKGYTVILTSLG